MAAPLAVTMGDPAGVGPEITRAAWSALRESGPAFFVIGDPALYGDEAAPIGSPQEAASLFPGKLPVLPLSLASEAQAGQPSGANADAVITSIEQAVALAADGQAGGVVTNPIAKSVLYSAGFAHPGHTEFVATLTGDLPFDGPRGPVMMLAGDKLRVALVSIHQPLREAIAGLTTDTIAHTARITHDALKRDFGIAAPRLALAGLNPHAGENGRMGHEDAGVIAPAITQLQAEGIDATGPHPADTLFAPHKRESYDVVIAMYHDQALVPLKTLDFDQGVNMTLGLPIIRTSPDHGTAFDIAGKDLARPDSFIAAIRTAAEAAANRSAAP